MDFGKRRETSRKLERVFEGEINEFLADPKIEVIDIKFTAVGDIKYPPRVYALVHYKIKS